MESAIFSVEEEIYSDKTLNYLDKLSRLQREVLNLTVDGFSASEIVKKLHITNREYTDCKMAIHSYRNASLLF